MSHVAGFFRRIGSLVMIELERSCRARTTWTLAAAMLVVASLVALGANHQGSAAAAAGAGSTVGGFGGGPSDPLAALGGVAALRVFVMLLGILCVTSEYHHGDIIWRYLAEPSRAVLVAGKAISCALVGALLGVLALQVATVVTFVQAGAGGGVLIPSADGALHTVLGTVGGTALAGVFGVGIGAAARNQTAAVVGTLVAVLVVEPVIAALLPGVAPFLPNASVTAVGFGGLALFGGYSIAAVTTGGVLCARNDVR